MSNGSILSTHNVGPTMFVNLTPAYVIIDPDPYCLYEIPKVTHFQWIRLRKGSADICLSFKLVIEKRF